MRWRSITTLLAVLVLLASTLTPVSARPPRRSYDSQRLRMVVRQSVAIIAPGDISLVHDLQEQSQTFPSQLWRVRGNVARGISVNFRVDRPFVHVSEEDLQCDAILNLALGRTIGPGDWTITTPYDQTNHVRGNDDATVSAQSDDSGGAEMLLSVTFVTGPVELLREGAYELVVTGTVAANQ